MAILFRSLLILLSLSTVVACSKKTTPTVSKPTTPATKAPSTAKDKPAPAPKKAYSGSELERDVLFYVNEYRKKKSLRPLVLEQAASEQAYVHSYNMAARRAAFGHDGFDKRMAAIQDAIGKIQGAAENVAFGQESPKEVVDGWIASPPHRKNLEGNFNLMGLGYARDAKGVVYFTQIFLRK